MTHRIPETLPMKDSTRPAGRPGSNARPATGSPRFEDLYRRLATARIRYEDLKTGHGSSLTDRFEARRALDGLRLEMARSRRELV